MQPGKLIGRLDRDSPRLLRIFLCHSSGDKAAVRELSQRLKSSGLEPWLDEEKLLPGQRWRDEIPRAVRESDLVIVCLSKASVNKAGYVQREIRYALDAALLQATREQYFSDPSEVGRL